MIFWRVFMRISYTCPTHLKFSLTIEKWSDLNALSGDAIDWLDKHENMYDVWLLVPYSVTSCALVQVSFQYLSRDRSDGPAFEVSHVGSTARYRCTGQVKEAA
jgi:hypothetical protein